MITFVISFTKYYEVWSTFIRRMYYIVIWSPATYCWIPLVILKWVKLIFPKLCFLCCRKDKVSDKICLSWTEYIKFATKFLTPRRKLRGPYKIYIDIIDQSDLIRFMVVVSIRLHTHELGRIKIRVRSGYLDPTVMGTEGGHLSESSVSNHYST